VILVTEEPERWAESAESVIAADRRVLEACSTTTTPQDPVAVLDRPESVATGPRRLIAWGIADPGNLGTMIRTAAAVGVDVVVGGPGSADPWSPKVVRSGAGAHFTVAMEEVRGFGAALGGREGLALVVAGGIPPDPDPEGSWGLVVGSEAHGLPAEVVDACRPVTLPMPGGTESLNAAVAAAVALYSLAV
jgi:TrmH family RNA methyltransferase